MWGSSYAPKNEKQGLTAGERAPWQVYGQLDVERCQSTLRSIQAVLLTLQRACGEETLEVMGSAVHCRT